MNEFSTVLVFLFIRLSDEFVDSAGLTALNDSFHTITLYEELMNEDLPSERDPARADPNIRKSICEDIATSGFLKLVAAGQLDFVEMYDNLKHPNYADIFNLIYTYNVDDQEYVYTNPYRALEFFGPDTDTFKEYVFVCLSRFWSYSVIYPFYVTKEYNVAPPSLPYKPGRFVFAFENSTLTLVSPIWYDYALLAEEPATVYAETQFNVEIYFLNIRKYIRPAESNVFDPLCKLISDDDNDAHNQHYRFCVAVSRSSHYRDTFEYPHWNASHCEYLEVSFKTPQGKKRAAGKPYYERMTPCYSQFWQRRNRGATYLYISRAYRSDRVLVYQLDPVDGNIYLENLSSNVFIVDELNSFDFVEE